MEYHEGLVETIQKISQMMGEFEDRALNSGELADLTVTQIYYLDVINRLENPTPSELASELNVTKPTITLTINRLADAHCIEKVQSREDRRVYFIKLTPKGRRIVDAHDNAHKEFAKQIMKCLDREEIEHVVRIFEKIIKCYPGE
ncbi:MAG: Transcriptional regulator of fatty acid biosynthesis FabT [Firmicutes bacterium]|nr:Transcriptional regulator of fatty acid biosynthesis FabT [Bacillota bacterium]MDI6706816.1 MarR family transcriptional regulator [Bacillota bacterium]